MPSPISITLDARRQIVSSLPAAMRPDWLVQTWSGDHGSRGLTSAIRSASSEVKLEGPELFGTGRVSGSVYDGSRDVGEFYRSVNLHRSGRLEVHHDLLDLRPQAQGTGFARSFNEQAFARYAEAGVDDVTVYASLDVGGYAWARQGFEIDASGAAAGEQELHRARVIRDLVGSAEYDGALTADDIAVLEPRLLGADEVVHPHTLTSVQELAAMPHIGRSALLEQSWEGIREIRREQAWWQPATPGTRDALKGISYLTAPETTTQRVAAAARRVEATLPAPHRNDDVRDAFQRHFGASAYVAKPTKTEIGVDGDQLTVKSRTVAVVDGAKVVADVGAAKNGTLHVNQSISHDAESVVPTLDAVWRDLGVSTTSGPGRRRSL